MLYPGTVSVLYCSNPNRDHRHGTKQCVHAFEAECRPHTACNALNVLHLTCMTHVVCGLSQKLFAGTRCPIFNEIHQEAAKALLQHSLCLGTACKSCALAEQSSVNFPGIFSRMLARLRAWHHGSSPHDCDTDHQQRQDRHMESK